MDYSLKDFGKQLKKNHLVLRRHFSSLHTDSYRVYDQNIGKLPVTVDIYASFVHILDYREKVCSGEVPEEAIIDTVSRMLYVAKNQIVYKLRKPRKGMVQHGKLSETGAMLGIHENGLSFLVNLNDYIDTGLFLDHRKTREMVLASATGKAVLNLFAYTGSFSVYAAAGGAGTVDTVDLSRRYVAWAKSNFGLNNLHGDRYSFFVSDAGEYLKAAQKSGKKYDIIVLDPPTFSNSRKMAGTFDIQRDYLSMINACCHVLNRDGFVLFSTNYRKFHFDPGRLRACRTTDITVSTIDLDFSKKRKPHRCWIVERKK